MTVREATISLLEHLGMTTIFGNPGSTELPLFRDFPPLFRYVLGLQESVVLGMADGFAQATRNAAFVNLHASAGVGHALGTCLPLIATRRPWLSPQGNKRAPFCRLSPSYLPSAQPSFHGLSLNGPSNRRAPKMFLPPLPVPIISR